MFWIRIFNYSGLIIRNINGPKKKRCSNFAVNEKAWSALHTYALKQKTWLHLGVCKKKNFTSFSDSDSFSFDLFLLLLVPIHFGISSALLPSVCVVIVFFNGKIGFASYRRPLDNLSFQQSQKCQQRNDDPAKNVREAGGGACCSFSSVN